jgi:hypothetical protein
MGSISVRGGGAWNAAKGVWVSAAGSKPAKAVWSKSGGAWRRSWTFPIGSATLSLSKTGVTTNEQYNVTLTVNAVAGYPTGFPAESAVVFKIPGGAWTVIPGEGATTATLPGCYHATAGTYAWTAEVFTVGRTTAQVYGPVNQSVTGVVTYHAHPGQSTQTIQLAMNAHSTGSVFNFEPGAYTLTNNSANTGRTASLMMKSNLSVKATGCTFTVSSALTNQGSGGGYTRAGGWTWDGGTFECNQAANTAFSVAHSPSFTIQNIIVRNNEFEGHGIEINSSGGAASATSVISMTDAQFTVKILGCEFQGSDFLPRAEDYDEAIHFDYAWVGSSSPAAPDEDGTVCNNVLVQGNWVHKIASMSYSYPVAVGTHHGVGDTSRVLPDAQHSHIKIASNTFDNVSPRNFAANGRGAVHLRNSMKQVWVYANTFNSCYSGVTMGIVNLATPGFPAAASIWITDNTFNACTGTYEWVDTDSTDTGSNDYWSTVSINRNKFTGAINAAMTTWLIGCKNVAGLSVQNNYFYGLTGGGGSPALSASTGNRIHGTAAAPAAGTSGMTCDNNMWSASAAGTGAVESNS